MNATLIGAAMLVTGAAAFGVALGMNHLITAPLTVQTVPEGPAPFITERRLPLPGAGAPSAIPSPSPEQSVSLPQPAATQPLEAPQTASEMPAGRTALSMTAAPSAAASGPVIGRISDPDSLIAFDQDMPVNSLLPRGNLPVDAGAPTPRHGFTDLPMIGVYR